MSLFDIAIRGARPTIHRRLPRGFGALALLVAAAAPVSHREIRAESDQSNGAPNVVLFLADDLGWGDLGCYGHDVIQTPHLDAFARQGVRLTQCYAASGVCSPSRSAILTGRTPYRNGVYTWIPANREIHLRKSEIALPKLLKERGYATCHVGKWHLNGYFNDPRHPQPGDHGYEWWLATQNNAAPSHANPRNFVRNGKPVGELEGYSAPLVVAEAIDWLKNHRDKSKPFFLAVWTHEPHYPIASAPEFRAKYGDLTDKVQIEHHANVTQLDHAFGQLMAALDEIDVAKNTFVAFTSDNGPEGDGIKSPGRGSTGGLRGRKRAVYEGGIRVPGMIRWPEHIDAGGENGTPVIGSDLFNTVCALAGGKIPADRVIDGGNLLPALKGKAIERQRPLYWHCDIAPGDMKVAMRVDDWKVVANEALTKFELYDLKTDWQEKKDLAADRPEILAELKQQLSDLSAEIEKEGPTWSRTPKPAGRAGRAKREAVSP